MKRRGFLKLLGLTPLLGYATNVTVKHERIPFNNDVLTKFSKVEPIGYDDMYDVSRYMGKNLSAKLDKDIFDAINKVIKETK